MNLRVVGTYKQQTINPTIVKRETVEKLDEEVPLIDETSQKLTQNQLSSQYKAKFIINQDPRKSRFHHGKLILIQKVIIFLNIVIFFLSIAKTEADIQQKKSGGMTAYYLMQTISVCIGGLALICWCRSLSNFQLQVQQSKSYNKKGNGILLGWFKDNSRIIQYIKQLSIILPHPNVWLQGQTFKMKNSLNDQEVIFSINDILSLLLLLKVYFVIRALISLSSYFSPRTSRLCYRGGLQHNYLFVIKCILHQQPLTAIGFCFFTILVIFGYGLKTSEGVLFLHNLNTNDYSKAPNYQNYSNCFWLVFITMSTVGYGDISPTTLPGRIVIFFTATTGVLLSSLLIVSLSIYLQMQSTQSKAHITLARLQNQSQLIKQATAALIYTIKIRGNIDKNLQQQFFLLKRQIDLVKNKSRQIKSMVDTDNIVEEMDRQFIILKSSFKDIYQGQIKITQQLSKIKQIQNIKLSFIKQVTQMLHKEKDSKQSNKNSQI